MKVLFVCWANVGRSQMAKAYYNQLTNTDNASSAGTEVEEPGETLGQRRERRGGTHVIEAMELDNIDVTNFPKTQLTPEMLQKYDKVYCMAQPEYTPDWLENAPNVTRWTIDDPGGRGLEETVIARNLIKDKVLDLLAEK